MKKLLAIAAVIVGALVVLLWLELKAPAEAAVVPAKAAPTPVAVATDVAKQTEQAEIAKRLAAAAKTDDGKISKASDEFFYRFDDLQPSMLTRNAAKCYTGGLHRVHRNQKVKLAFSNRIKNGEVTVENVTVVSDETTIDDPALVECFRKAVADTHWHDDQLPDYTAPDELVIRPERGMKKYTEENMKYEGSGPDFTHRAPGT
jgi:hypothetical protein